MQAVHRSVQANKLGVVADVHHAVLAPDEALLAAVEMTRRHVELLFRVDVERLPAHEDAVRRLCLVLVLVGRVDVFGVGGVLLGGLVQRRTSCSDGKQCDRVSGGPNKRYGGSS